MTPSPLAGRLVLVVDDEERIIRFVRLHFEQKGARVIEAHDGRAALEMETEQWQRVIDINLTGVWNSCKAEAELMLESGGGSIINIASMSGIIVNRGLDQAPFSIFI